MSETKIKLYQKISKVMKDVAYLSKDDKIEFNNTKYRAISEEKVTSAVRTAMLEHGLIIIPVKQAHSRAGTLSIVDTEYKIIDIETGEHEIIVSSGTGADTQDKGVGKAMTYSFKYLLLRTFAIPTGEDPDKVSSAELDAKAEADRKKAEETNSKLRKQIEIKWKTIQGDINGMDDWIAGQLKAGRTLEQMHAAITQRALQKAEEQKETK